MVVVVTGPPESSSMVAGGFETEPYFAVTNLEIVVLLVEAILLSP